MRKRLWITSLALIALMGAAAIAMANPFDPIPTSAVDCKGYSWGESLSTAEFRQRDTENVFCAEQRYVDRSVNPQGRTVGGYGLDPYRTPARHDNIRFRFSSPAIPGVPVAEMYMPCSTDTNICPNLPDGLQRFDAPYPAVITMHGIISQRAFQWWAAQSLAEAGYLVLNLDTSPNNSANTAPTPAHAQAALTWLVNNPDVDKDRIGVSGHSQGGGVSFNLAQTDSRVATLVDEDDYTGSTGAGEYKPTLLLFADYEGFPGYPQPRSSAPSNPDNVRGDSGKYNAVANAADAMKLIVRATTHVDWVGHGAIGGNRYAENTSVYYMIAWYDRYLRGKIVGSETPAELAERQATAQDAFNRLTATSFDASADIHNISMGLWDQDKALASGDLLYGGNVPYSIAGTPTSNRLSFYWTSRCHLTVPGTSDQVSSDNIRINGC